MTRRLVVPAKRIEGALQVPGDKSISHRALLVAAVAAGTTRIKGLSPARDVRATLDLLAQLGARVSSSGAQPTAAYSESKVEVQNDWGLGDALDFQIMVESPGRTAWHPPQRPVDVGNSGSTIRMGLGALAPSDVKTVLTGDDSIRRRPMRRVVEPLRRMGATIEGADDAEHAPLTINGAKLHGLTHDLPIASAQVKSAILLAGLGADGTTEVLEPAPSRDHTERMLAYLDAPISLSTNRCIVSSAALQARDLDIPGDISSAAFLLAAAAILPGSDLTVSNVGLNPTRTGFLEILERFGAGVEIEVADEVCGEPRGKVRVRAGDRRAFEVDGASTLAALDELPLVGVLGAFADGGVTVVRDASELRVKESDRIAAITGGLRRMGLGVEATPDGFTVRGGRPLGAVVDPMGDHRIAMALAVAALGAEGETSIEGWECVGVSYPGFQFDLERLLVR